MRGIYILTCDALQQMKTIKIGMSLKIEKRWYDYEKFFNNCHYLFCYILNDYSKDYILSIEKTILDLTKQFKTELFKTEFRLCDDITPFSLKNGTLSNENM